MRVIVLLACSLATQAAAPANFPQPGEWPCFRRDGGLLARSPAHGQIAEPQIVWRQFVGSLQTELIAERGKSKKLALPIDEAPSDREFAEALAHFHRKESVADPNESSSDPTTTIFADVVPEESGREKIEFESAFAKPTLHGQWQPCVGRCFAQRAGQWVKVWESAPIDLLFQPLPLAGDFDADGALDIAILPFHELILLDARTGRIKSRCRFTDTRSYGLFGSYDFDHDGRAEFLVMGDFSKHVDVLGFRESELTVLWQRAIELDISNPRKVLRVGPQPVADVDGDGRDEILISLFNDDGDGRWHLTAHDALTGRVKCELPDEQLAGALDLDGDGANELLTTRSNGAGAPDYGAISVWSMREGAGRRLWTREHAAWQMCDAPLPANVKSTATLGRRTVLNRLVEGRQVVVVRERDGQEPVTVRELVWIDGTFSTQLSVTSYDLEAAALDGHGRMLLRSEHAPGARVGVSTAGAQVIVGETKRTGISPGPVAVAWPLGAERPTIVVQGAGEELAAFEAAPHAASSPKFRRIRGRGQSSQWPEARGPVVADLLGDGQRQILFATATPAGHARLVAWDLSGRAMWHHDFRHIPAGPPMWNVGGIILWQVGHFTARGSGNQRPQTSTKSQRSSPHPTLSPHRMRGEGGLWPGEGWLGKFEHSAKTLTDSSPARVSDHRPRVGGEAILRSNRVVSDSDASLARHQDVLVTVRRSMMHSEETLLLSGIDGRELWHRDRQVSQRGVGGAPFAIADFDGDGLEDACSLHPSILYILQGATGRDILARDATWEAVPAKPVYWGIPAAGDFLGDGHAAIFFGGRSMTGLIRADGSLAWWDALDRSAPGWPAFGDFDADGRLEAIGIGYDDGVRCYDLATGEVKWRLPAPAPGNVAGSASGDLDGDGRDEAIFVMGQELVCLGAARGTGSLKWKLHLPAACGPPTLASTDQSRTLSVLLAGSDGYVYCVR